MIQFTTQQVDEMLKYLGTIPFNQANPLIVYIQGVMQKQPKEETKPKK